MTLRIGSPAPAFDLPATSGGNVSLASLRGKKVVLYFYPRDMTPGCTVEACDFRDRHGALAAAGAVVLGVSKDSLGSHDKFRDKYGLPFTLLADTDSVVAKKYGAYGQKMMYGKPVIGTIRTTVVIDEKGAVARVWSPVKVAGHGDAVLAFVRGEPDAPSAKPAAKKPAAKKPAAKKPAAKKPAAKKPAAKKPAAKKPAAKKTARRAR